VGAGWICAVVRLCCCATGLHPVRVPSGSGLLCTVRTLDHSTSMAPHPALQITSTSTSQARGRAEGLCLWTAVPALPPCTPARLFASPFLLSFSSAMAAWQLCSHLLWPANITGACWGCCIAGTGSSVAPTTSPCRKNGLVN